MKFLESLFNPEKKPDPAEVAQLENEYKELEKEMGGFVREMRKDEIAVKEQGPAFIEEKLKEIKGRKDEAA